MVIHDGVTPETHYFAAGRALGSEPEDAAQSAVDIIHEGCLKVADRLIEVCLVEGNQGGDVDD